MLQCYINIPSDTFWAIALERNLALKEKEKKSLTPVGFEPTNSETESPLLYQLSYKARDVY